MSVAVPFDQNIEMVEVNTSDDDGVSVCVGSPYDETEFLDISASTKQITDRLASSGPEGVAAAAAIVSTRKRQRPHMFETDPSVRKRQQNKLMRKLQQTIDEFATRVGQQAVVIIKSPGNNAGSFKVFGAKPLGTVIKNLQLVIMEKLNCAIAEQTPPPVAEDPNLFELPPLIIDGIPTPVEKMTQAQLRAFIPLMLKYSLRRGKPGWGRESFRPLWWPEELPWANVRMDARSELDKQKNSWTKVLRQIVINCYKYHGREDLLPECLDEESHSDSKTKIMNDCPTVLKSFTNPDGTVSFIQMDTNSSVITLADGSTVRQIAPMFQVKTDEYLEQNENALSDTDSQDANSVTEATLNPDGQLMLTGEDGQAYPVLLNQLFEYPNSTNAYQNVMTAGKQDAPNGAIYANPAIIQLQSDSYSSALVDQYGNIIIDLDKLTSVIKLERDT